MCLTHFTPNTLKWISYLQGPFEVLRLDMWSRVQMFVSVLETQNMLMKCFLLGSIADECFPGLEREIWLRGGRHSGLEEGRALSPLRVSTRLLPAACRLPNLHQPLKSDGPVRSWKESGRVNQCKDRKGRAPGLAPGLPRVKFQFSRCLHKQKPVPIAASPDAGESYPVALAVDQ